MSADEALSRLLEAVDRELVRRGELCPECMCRYDDTERHGDVERAGFCRGHLAREVMET